MSAVRREVRTSSLCPFQTGCDGGAGVYNRYIPEGHPYTPVDPPTGEQVSRKKGRLSPENLLKRIRPEKLDTGDILLALIVLLLWKDSEDTDLLLAFGGAMLMGEEEDQGV